MAIRGLVRRLDRLRRAGLAEEIGKIVVVVPDEWPAEARDAYEAACAAGDLVRQADLIEAQTGERPVFSPTRISVIRYHKPPELIEPRARPDGPR